MAICLLAGFGVRLKRSTLPSAKRGGREYLSYCPGVVREKWGEEVADQFTTWLEVVLRERTIGRDEYREIFSRLDFLEKDFSVVFWKGT